MERNNLKGVFEVVKCTLLKQRVTQDKTEISSINKDVLEDPWAKLAICWAGLIWSPITNDYEQQGMLK